MASSAGINFSVEKITGPTIAGHHVSFTGNTKIGSGRRKTKVTFTINATDNGLAGMNDQFSVQISNSYSAGVLTSGDIFVH